MVRFAQISLKKWVSLRSLAGVGLVSVGKVSWRRRPAVLCGQPFGEHFRRSQAGESPEVLGGRREQELVAGAVRTPEAQAREAQDPLEMGE